MLKLYWGDLFTTPCALLLGGFDGLHRGHGSLFERARKTNLPVGITTITGGKAGGDVFTLQERERIFAEEGFAFVLELRYSEIKDVSAEEFLQKLFSSVCAKAVFCGEDFRFGKGALGTAELLQELSPCPTIVLPLKKLGGEKIAISTVKKALDEGDLAAVNALLCKPFFVEGTVEQGRRVGRTLDFPTVNLTYPAEKFPLREGVYAGTVETDAGVFSSIVNIGARPTFGVEEKKVEAYLKGFSGDLYGTKICVYPKKFLRPIYRFENVGQLKEQLKKDLLVLNGE